MSIPIDPREVYEYLQELGYDNISSKQLKEFIHDLKKLIKYEERKSKCNQDKENIPQKSVEKPDVFQNLYEANTEASKAKIVQSKKDKIITVQIKKHKETCRHYKQNPNEESHKIDDNLKNNLKNNLLKSEVTPSESKETKISQISLNSNHSDKTITTKKSDKNIGTILISEEDKKSSVKGSEHLELKPKASFIRPKSVKSAKSDPVSLYHKYQAEWKKQKIPGVENHSNLRWVIREKMLGDQQSSLSGHTVKKRLNRHSNRY